MSCPSQQPVLPSENTYSASGCASRRIRVSPPRRSMWTRYVSARMRRYGVHFRHAGRYQIFNKRGGDVAEGGSIMDVRLWMPLHSPPGWNLYRYFLYSSSSVFLMYSPRFRDRAFSLNDEVKSGRREHLEYLFLLCFEIVSKFDWFVGCLCMTIIS